MSDSTAALKFQLQKLDVDHSTTVDEGHLRRVVALLNRLSLSTFDTVSDEIIRVMNEPGKGHTSIPASRLAHLVYEKAVRQSRDENPEMYARLSRKITSNLSSSFKDNRVKDTNGTPVAGGQLFRKHLARLCKDAFEWRWTLERTTRMQNNAMNNLAYLEEYYAARRQGLAVIKFMCELLKLRMLTDRTMHRLFKTLLVGLDQPGDAGAQVEALCMLVSSVGVLLDTADGKARMDIYFRHMEQTKAHLAPGQALDMLQDVLDTREHGWHRPYGSAAHRADSINVFTEPELKEQVKQDGNHDARSSLSSPNPDHSPQRDTASTKLAAPMHGSPLPPSLSNSKGSTPALDHPANSPPSQVPGAQPELQPWMYQQHMTPDQQEYMTAGIQYYPPPWAYDYAHPDIQSGQVSAAPMSDWPPWNVTSQPGPEIPTLSSASSPSSPPTRSGFLNTAATTFVPGGRAKSPKTITLKRTDGQTVDLNALKAFSPTLGSPATSSSSRKQVRLESVADRTKRLADESKAQAEQDGLQNEEVKAEQQEE